MAGWPVTGGCGQSGHVRALHMAGAARKITAAASTGGVQVETTCISRNAQDLPYVMSKLQK